MARLRISRKFRTAAACARGFAQLGGLGHRSGMPVWRRSGYYLAVSAGVLATVGGPGGWQPAGLVTSSAVLTWAKQAPAAHPSARADTSMAYDAATSTVVLFGGGGRRVLADTWAWNGTTWAKQHPAIHPRALSGASMVYDAATSTVVLFGGGGNGRLLSDTWTWNGTTWAKQHPAHRPPGRIETTMAYDAATSTVVLFGGLGGLKKLSDTWLWGSK
jgi:hypothetical protein